ncbi:bacteriocin-type transport-associated family protein [Synechococcus sp. PROS-7-1]|uniref:cyclic nucleotide-binding domain-containing protein n=1 Tax=Synechococcus sp. PROS-7-1 TaxID=1442556 RepID=UPI0016441C12|nr:cyclic nucleotide-binding domain-containing protein [Synechococcus sp. PROS-7-1]QNI86495.1 bacteriocin-type transport-associated family protein [Synechococcus sp. PROS-7-1]
MFDYTVEASQCLQSWLRENGKREVKSNGSKLIEEGLISEHVLVLLKGQIAVNTTDQNGASQRLAVLNQGAIVGEMSWLEQRPAVADVIAEADSEVLFLSVDLLDKLSNDEPELAAEWQRLIARKLAAQIKSQNAWIHRYEGPGEEIEPLRKVLVLFAVLDDLDVEQIAKMGSLRRIAPGNILLKQGEEVPSIYLILAGEADIWVNIEGINKKVGTSRRGELLGELTLLTSESQGASATVSSTDGMELLEINKNDLQKALRETPAFADRFFRSLSCMMSQRSRDQLLARQLAARSRSAEADDDDDELDLGQLGGINRAGQRFHTLCQKFQSGGETRL